LTFEECDQLRSFTFDSPSRVRFLFSIPSPCCSSIDIPDSVEVLESIVRVESDGHLVLSFSSNTHLRNFKLLPGPYYLSLSSRINCRASVRLCESPLWWFRSNLSLDGL
jgi:hypothetical protein